MPLLKAFSTIRPVKISRGSDLALALFVVAIATMLLVPLPTFLLDILLAANISFSVLLLIVGLYMPNALALLAFPSLLLLTTLFRLGLNVASARLILSQGHAGQVIESFGTFLIRGELAVGIIIFTIITIVNFIVIAKGASRVSEVAARFALDALPGKQLALDSDLRAGLLTPDQAHAKREELRMESQLYGSMDGAMKFVQGDAIAGFFIIAANIVGGIYLGLKNGLGFEEAIHTYTVLTVGDGLVSQVPALLISICAGIVVTRVSGAENTTLGSDLTEQLFGRPIALLISGLVLLFLGLLPGLPFLPFLLVSTIFMVTAYLLQKRPLREGGQALQRLDYSPSSNAHAGGGGGNEQTDEDSSLLVMLDAAVLYRVYRLNAQSYQAWWKDFQSDFFAETGLRLPSPKVVADEALGSSSYAIYFDHTLIDSGSIFPGGVLVEMCPDCAHLFDIDVAAEADHPLTGHRVFWTVQTPASRKILDAGQIRTYDFIEFLALKIGVFYNRHPEEVLTLTDVHHQLRVIDKKYPGLLADAMIKNSIDVSKITELLQQLVREGIGVRDFRQIIESIANYCSTYRSILGDGEEVDLEHLVAFVRGQRKRQLAARFCADGRTLKVYALSPEVEGLFDDLPNEGAGGALPIEPEALDSLRNGLEMVRKPISRNGVLPIVLLCKGEIRSKVNRFILSTSGKEAVIGFNELDTSVQVEQMGLWDLL